MEIGDEVVCIAPLESLNGCVPVLKNEIYTIRGFSYGKAKTGVYLEGITNPVHYYSRREYSYNITRFVPLEYNSSAIAELVNEKEKVK